MLQRAGRCGLILGITEAEVAAAVGLRATKTELREFTKKERELNADNITAKRDRAIQTYAGQQYVFINSMARSTKLGNFDMGRDDGGYFREAGDQDGFYPKTKATQEDRCNYVVDGGLALDVANGIVTFRHFKTVTQNGIEDCPKADSDCYSFVSETGADEERAVTEQAFWDKARDFSEKVEKLSEEQAWKQRPWIYRAASQEDAAKLLGGDSITVNEFFSTADRYVKETYFNQPGRVMLMIHVRPGSKFMPLHDTRKHQDYNNLEQEILFTPGHKMQLIHAHDDDPGQAATTYFKADKFSKQHNDQISRAIPVFLGPDEDWQKNGTLTYGTRRGSASSKPKVLVSEKFRDWFSRAICEQAFPAEATTTFNFTNWLILEKMMESHLKRLESDSLKAQGESWLGAMKRRSIIMSILTRRAGPAWFVPSEEGVDKSDLTDGKLRYSLTPTGEAHFKSYVSRIIGKADNNELQDIFDSIASDSIAMK